jgi:hypothetical protein
LTSWKNKSAKGQSQRTRVSIACLGYVLLWWSLGASQSSADLPSSFPLAITMRGCSQEDAAAIVIVLSVRPQAQIPRLEIEIVGLTEAARYPIHLSLSPLRRERFDTPLFARAHVWKSDVEHVWLSGDLELKSIAIGQRAQGAFSFRTPDGQGLVGQFDAPWQAGSAQCG